MRIAIVDDLAAERHFLREQLEQKLYRMGIQADILEYTCGEAFLEAEHKLPFSVAFLDIYMMGMTGIEAARELRKTDTDCLLIFTTTSTDHALEGFQVRAMHYLVKPYTEDDDDFDEFDDDARPSRPSRSSTAPKPSYSGFDLDNDDLSSSGSSSNTGRRTLGGSNASNGKVVNIHTTAQMQVVLVKPDRFDNVSDIAEHLRSKHAVVLNLESTNKDVARRLVDFLSGCAYALDGKIKKIAISTYIITPYNVDIVGDLIDELENNGVYL